MFVFREEKILGWIIFLIWVLEIMSFLMILLIVDVLIKMLMDCGCYVLMVLVKKMAWVLGWYQKS